MKRPALSLILCSRNDQYMGNSRWRLAATLNYVAARLDALGRLDDVEVLVADWGSDVPLADVIPLDPPARRVVSYLWIRPALARELQGDSPFPEVLALNAAARRASGAVIGRIDQDTLVGSRFFDWFFASAEEPEAAPFPWSTTPMFSQRRSIPFRLAVRCPDLATLESAINRATPRMLVESAPSWAPFYASAVGIFLVPRPLWDECGGYDEEMVYMGAMETNMVGRLMKKYPVVDIGPAVGYDFYHLEHHHPWSTRSCWADRRPNDDVAKLGAALDVINPNGPSWGLRDAEVDTIPAREASGQSVSASMAVGGGRSEPLALVATQVRVEAFLIATSRLPSRGLALATVWVHRWRVAVETVRGKPIRTWASALRERARNPRRDIRYDVPVTRHTDLPRSPKANKASPPTH